MDRTFDIRRFGRYLVYDLRNAWNNAGFTLLVYGLAPIFFFFFYEICCLVFSGYFGDFGLGWRIPFLFVLMLVCFYPAARKALRPRDRQTLRHRVPDAAGFDLREVPLLGDSHRRRDAAVPVAHAAGFRHPARTDFRCPVRRAPAFHGQFRTLWGRSSCRGR